MKNSVTFWLLIVAAVTAAPFSRVSADTFTIGGAIYTDLYDPINSGLPGVDVTVEQIDGPFVDTVVTGDNGIWVMYNVPEGTYTVMPTLATLDGRYCFIEVLAGMTLGERPPIIILVDADQEIPNQNIKFLAEWCPDDGLYCTGPEICDQELGCISAGDPCASSGLTCDEEGDRCICETSAQCDDQVYCTDDACVDDQCVHTANDENCPDDGLFCNGDEFCDPVMDCTTSGDPCVGTDEPYCMEEGSGRCAACLNDGHCDDEVDCTHDVCMDGTCVNTPDDELCTNGYWCHPEQGCIPEEPGACCLGGGCLPNVERSLCESACGIFAGYGADCSVCELGACCYQTTCFPDQQEVSCLGTGGQWAGPASECPANAADLCPICDDGDASEDGDVDLEDFAAFQTCLEVPYTAGCKCVDMNNDYGVDLCDYRLFQVVLDSGGPQ